MYDVKMNDRTVPLYLRVLIYVYFFLEFFEPYLNMVVGSYTKYYLILLILALVQYYGFKVKKDGIAISFFLWFIYKCITIIWCKNMYIPQLHFFTNLTAVILLYLLVMYPLDRVTLDGITKSLWLGSGAIGVLSLFFNAPFLGVSNRIVLKLFGVTVDPNNDAAFLAVGIAISLYYVVSQNKGVTIKLISIISILINTYALFLTGSRGGLLTEIAIIAVLALFYIQKGRHKLFFIIGLVLILFSLNYLIQNYLPTDIYYRLFEVSTYEGGSERTEIWGNAFELMRSDILFYLFGAGWGSYYGYNGYYVVMHNTFISMLCDTGIIGLLLFYSPIVKATKYLYKEKCILPLLLLVAGFVPSFFLEAINKRFFWNAVMFLLMFYEFHSNQEYLE